MSNYSLFVLPPEAFTTSDGGYQPIRDPNTADDGSGWKDAYGTFTYTRQSAVEISVHDTDQNNQSLDDNAPGESTQFLIEPIERFSAGSALENEFEITLNATVDGVLKEYRLVAISSQGQIVGYTFKGEWPPEHTHLSAVWKGTEDSDNNSLSVNQMQAPCFTRGTMIATPNGEIAIENLHEGDLVLTRDHGAQPIGWIGSAYLDARTLAANKNMQPIRIRAGALGMGLPKQDLLVSPQHRVLLRSRIAMKMFGAAEVLVAAKQLLQIDGIDIAAECTEIEYFHMLFDQHEIVISNGAETESLYPGPEALKSVGAAALDEIFAIFPELRSLQAAPDGARLLLSGRQSRKLVVRHVQHTRALVVPTV
ncbi:Hint domain-containing protein [Paracoccus laeviglucosivorans]|uniref:Hint domain-containing protein n=1 Tax=Paracoccus laeviglucosivorans TaxID=1197861 RepID=A0A521BCH4_9RHOB|nr:Hint domain-containing protein [Paracoccus laeviglucosivorans]SMO44739.1 Hint domain-containing protein [Paracoccus laeviglucosivorans]